MTTRKCVVCKKRKLIKYFYVYNKKATSKRKAYKWQDSRCKFCWKIFRKKERKRYRKNYQEYYKRYKLVLLKYLKEHPCVDCGEKDFRVLQFDHVRGVKKHNVGNYTTSPGRLEKEIAKCEIRCANCHHKRHYKR